MPIESAPILLAKPAYWIIGLIGALVPLIFRTGLTKFQAGLMAVCGMFGAVVFTHPLTMWVSALLHWEYVDIDNAIAFTIGILSMRVAESLLKFIERRGLRLLGIRI